MHDRASDGLEPPRIPGYRVPLPVGLAKSDIDDRNAARIATDARIGAVAIDYFTLPLRAACAHPAL